MQSVVSTTTFQSALSRSFHTLQKADPHRPADTWDYHRDIKHISRPSYWIKTWHAAEQTELVSRQPTESPLWVKPCLWLLIWTTACAPYWISTWWALSLATYLNPRPECHYWINQTSNWILYWTPSWLINRDLFTLYWLRSLYLNPHLPASSYFPEQETTAQSKPKRLHNSLDLWPSDWPESPKVLVTVMFAK